MKLRFSADQFPEHERFDGWCDTFMRKIANAELTRLDDHSRPFEATVDAVALGRIAAAEVSGTPARFTCDPKQVADGSDDFTLVVTCEGQTGVQTAGTQSVVGKSGAQLITRRQSGHMDFRADGGANGRFRVLRYDVPNSLLQAAIADPEALCFKGLTGNEQALNYLVQYTDQVLLRQDFDDPRLAERAGAHVFDLVATVLGPRRAMADVGRRGIRAARLASILAQIRIEFCDANFCVEAVARRHGVSARYVQRLLEEDGETFSHHVLRLRLERVAQLLADPAHRRMRISEIAAATGFSDLSYFNRVFRKRFGDTPRGYRK